jgi:hypothetical protein
VVKSFTRTLFPELSKNRQVENNGPLKAAIGGRERDLIGVSRSKRLVGGHRKTITFVASLRQNGVTVPGVIDGAMNGPMFLGYVEQILVPTPKGGDIVIMDNLSVHKVCRRPRSD